jgi:hypothetical protein
MSQTVTKTVTFSFTDPSGGTDIVTVTESATATKIGKLGTGYAVSAISGSIDGVAITGEVGTGGKAQTEYGTNYTAYYDNTIFTSGGSKGNVDGIDNKGLEFTAGGVDYNLYTSNGQFELFNFNSTNGVGTPLTLISVSCFMAGTAVRTPSGDVAVETLKAGDLVTLSDGRTAPVCWLGRQTVSVVFADPLRVLPIRIKAGALGGNLPARDLLLSPDHALLVDNVLIQAGALVNGISILRETTVPPVFTYYHVEVADHSLILAENTPAETFVDNVDRMGFDNWAEHEALVGDTAIVEMEYPRAKSARQVPQATRARLAAIAEALFGTQQAA